MKKIVLSSFVIASLLVSQGKEVLAQTLALNPAKTEKAAKPAATTYKIDPIQSKIGWNGKKVAGEHSGTIGVAGGSFQVAKNKVVGGTVEIDMNSIVNVDITDREYNQKLVGHLKSDDFFSTEKHPKATFKITSLTPIKGAKAGASNYTAKGNLTIKGITNPVSFPVTVAVKENAISAKSESVVLDRTKWDIRYNSKTFFSTIGDKAIYDDFTVQFNVVAKK
ncbi:MAG: YceI family protein [Adhaeribacter sp.]